MNLEPNFPSAIPLTEEELAEVLTEFHRRGRSEVKHLAPPPPFEVTSSIVQTTSSRPPPDTAHEDPSLIIPPQAFPLLEKDFDFGISYLTPPTGEPNQLFPFYLEWYWRCHDQGAVANESYIRLYPGAYWQSFNPPGYGGGMRFSFNGSTWTPPGWDTPGVFISLAMTPLNFPVNNPQHPINIYEARMYHAWYIQEVDNPDNISDHIYPIGNPNPVALSYYQATHGVGFIIVFHGTIY